MAEVEEDTLEILEIPNREELYRRLHMKKAEVLSRNHDLDIADVMEVIEDWMEGFAK